MDEHAMELGRAAAARVDSERLRDLARKLIQIPSVWAPAVPGSGELEAAKFCEAYLREIGFDVHMYEAAPGRPNVIADWTPGGTRASEQDGDDLSVPPTLILEGHLDVVSVGDPEAWRHPPF